MSCEVFNNSDFGMIGGCRQTFSVDYMIFLMKNIILLHLHVNGVWLNMEKQKS